MKDVCCAYELSAEELDDVNGGFGAFIVAAFAVGVYMGYKQTH